MLTLTSEQFASKIKQHSAEITKLLERDLPRIVGREAVSHFKKNFQNEGWERTKWPEVQRRESGTKANKYAAKHHPAWTRRKILTGDTGDLGKSIQFTNDGGGKVTIHSDLIYAAVHNYGLKAGRGKGFTMPQRQFIGESDELNAKIKEIIETKLNQIFSK
ncbi:MAG TPA: phage virion morphogenesis protein [Bacteroidales bacterium]|nr:phage virion morphogenesis protein [Bacteroidales bacterium]